MYIPPVSAVFGLLAKDSVFYAVFGKNIDVKIPFYCEPAINNIGDLLWFKKENKKQLLHQSNDLSFGYETHHMQIPFYQKSVTVDGQVAVMKINVVSNASEGNYVLQVQNMDNVYESFEFNIEVKGNWSLNTE